MAGGILRGKHQRSYNTCKYWWSWLPRATWQRSSCLFSSQKNEQTHVNSCFWGRLWYCWSNWDQKDCYHPPSSNLDQAMSLWLGLDPVKTIGDSAVWIPPSVGQCKSASVRCLLSAASRFYSCVQQTWWKRKNIQLKCLRIPPETATGPQETHLLKLRDIDQCCLFMTSWWKQNENIHSSLPSPKEECIPCVPYLGVSHDQ